LGLPWKNQNEKKRNADTNAFLTSLNDGALTLANFWLHCEQADEAGLHNLPQRWASRTAPAPIGNWPEECQPERAVRFARLLDKAKATFCQLALETWRTTRELTASVSQVP